MTFNESVIRVDVNASSKTKQWRRPWLTRLSTSNVSRAFDWLKTTLTQKP